MVFIKTSRPSAILGLTLEGRQLEGVLVQRVNGAPKVGRSFRAALTLDPLTNDPELVGREIRNQLDEAGIKERRCAVCIPLQWALTLQVKVPEVPEQDLPGFFQLEAERGFPYAPDDLILAISRYRLPNGDGYASLVAVPKSHVNLLEKVLRAARLKPVCFTLGIAAMRDAKDDTAAGMLTLAVGEACAELQVSVRGGVAAMRVLEGVFEGEGNERRMDADLIAREIRITLGQLPKELRETLSRIEVFGRPEISEPLVKALIPITREMGLLTGPGTMPAINGYETLGTDHPVAMASLCLAARQMAGQPREFEFLPPRQTPWKRAITRFSSAKVVYAGASLGAVLLLVGLAFLWQQWELTRLRSHAKVIKQRVAELDTLQKQERKIRSWFDDSAPGLRILRRLTEAFPEDGSVTAKTLSIKDLADITCSGQARDNQALINLEHQLRGPQIGELKMPQVRGDKPPYQFNFNYHWIEGASREN